MSEILSLSEEPESKSISHADLPWELIKSIVLSDSDCRDSIVADTLKSLDERNESDDLFGDTEDGDLISPLDIFYVVIQCCDPLVQCFLYKKLYLCKLAVPFRFWLTNRQQKIISLWPIRSVVIEHNGEECSAIQIPTSTVSFVRFARPNFSKSKLINHFLAKNSFDVFYNKDCPLGTEKRNLGTGCIEMFWKQSTNNHFTVFNLRGEMSTHIADSDMCILSEVTDILTVVIDIGDIARFQDDLGTIKKRFNRIILIVNNSKQGLEKQHNIVKKLREMDTIEVMVTFRNRKEISPNDLIEKLEELISKIIKSGGPMSLEDRLHNFYPSTGVAADSIARVEQIARDLITQLDKERQSCIPASSTYSRSIAKKSRESYKSNMEDSEKIKSEILDLYDLQTQSVYPVIRELAKTMVNIIHIDNLQLFMVWVSELLEIKQRQLLPQLIKVNKQAFELLWDIQDKNKNFAEIADQKKVVNDSSKKIDSNLFSVTHLLREISHIYEACFQRNILSERIALPKREEILSVFADLIIQGHPFELLDGESMYLPLAWVKHVFHKVHERIGREHVFILSILGLQSSGKSTLLNTMFGSQFAVSAGRCTRGVHIQLLSVSGQDMPFKYLLLIDTEGLRAPELSNDHFNHDNELATFVAGLGDTTVLNIMGENMSEISDIMQIMVHAFLRLKLANKRIDIKKRCTFVYHNVSEISASDKMHQGLQKIMTTLDEITEEAASSEGISDIFRFNQVIDFNIKKDVWHFPNLWKGNPPFASVNKRYSEKARDLRQHILKQAVHAENKSYKALDDIFIQIKNLWQGVSKENFVFSFRNSLALKAYCWLQTKYKDILWKTEQSFVEPMQHKANKMCSECRSIPDLNVLYDNFEEMMVKEHDIKGAEGRLLVLGLFKQEFKEILVEWKERTLRNFDNDWANLLNRFKDEIANLYRNRNAEIQMDSLIKVNEHTLYNKSKATAKRMKESGHDSEKHKVFNKLWKDFTRDIPTKSKNIDISNLFFEKMRDEFLKDESTMLRELKEKENWPTCEQKFKCLKDSLCCLEVDPSDLSQVGLLNRGLQWLGLFQTKGKVKLEVVLPRMVDIYASLDVEINHVCSTESMITEHHVKTILHEIAKKVEKLKRDKDKIGFTLKTTCKMKIYLHACRFIVMKYETHNKEQQSAISKRLLQKETEAKERFFAMVDERSAIDTAVLSFANVIATFVKEYIKIQMRNDVINILLDKTIPITKYKVMIDVVTDLVKCGRYHDWTHYLSFPDTHTKTWIEKRATEHLFGETCEYQMLATAKLEYSFKQIKTSIDKYYQEHSKTWINEFVSKTDLPIPSDKFSDVIRDFEEIKSLENIGDLRKQLIEEIEQKETEMKDEIKKINVNNVVWHGSNPYAEIFDRVWGCGEKCPFCKEPCTRDTLHEGHNHHCIQHRIDGCIGIHMIHTGKISLESCSYSVQSNATHTCGVFGYACNAGQSECSKKHHSYEKYKLYFPDWDIAPNPNVDDTSKVWMWFMAKFKDNLKNSYVKVDNIPERWNYITPEEAIESYNEFMTHPIPTISVKRPNTLLGRWLSTWGK